MATKIEQRSFSLRAAGEEFCLEGRALSYQEVSSNEIAPGVREQIMAGAFREYLASGEDTKATVNHSVDRLLARRINGTLKITDTATALNVRIQLDRNQQAHRDLWASVRRGDLSEMSFGFQCLDEDYAPGTYEGKACQVRSVRKARLLDIAVVASPFYGGGATEVSARSAAAAATAGSTPWERAGMSPDQWLKSSASDAIRARAVADAGKLVARDKAQATAEADRQKAAKEALLDSLQASMDELYGPRYRVVDADYDPDNGYTLVARDLNSDEEDFVMQDFDLDDEDSRCFGPRFKRMAKGIPDPDAGYTIRLSGRPRKAMPSGTMWVSSLRGIRAAAAWREKKHDRDLARRMETAAGFRKTL